MGEGWCRMRRVMRREWEGWGGEGEVCRVLRLHVSLDNVRGTGPGRCVGFRPRPRDVSDPTRPRRTLQANQRCWQLTYWKHPITLNASTFSSFPSSSISSHNSSTNQPTSS